MFLDLPRDIHQRIADELYGYDRLKLSTCHSTLEEYGHLREVYLDIADETSVDSFCLWLRKNRGTIRRLSVYDTTGVLGDNTLSEKFQRCLEISCTAVEDISMNLRYHLPSILSRLPSVKTAYFSDGGFPQLPSLSRNEALDTLCIRGGLEVTGDLMHASDLVGIAEAPKLRSLSIRGQDARLCLCELPQLHHLTRLEIIGTRDTWNVVRDVHALPRLPHLKHVVLDSSSALIDDLETDLGHLENIETLDVSRRHEKSPWNAYNNVLHKASPTLIDFLGRMPHLKTLGAGDLILDHSAHSASLETMHMSLLSFVASVGAALTFDTFPKIQELCIETATSLELGMHVEEGFIRFLSRVPLKLRLRRGPGPAEGHAFENERLTVWFRIASYCPHLTIQIE